MTTLIESNGTETVVLPANGETFTLEELQNLVGGYIELTYTTDSRMMIVNEEGKLKQSPVNLRATLRHAYGAVDTIVGDAVVLEKGEMD
jgi:hypothetical protein